jgi:hypothetical protein
MSYRYSFEYRYVLVTGLFVYFRNERGDWTQIKAINGNVMTTDNNNCWSVPLCFERNNQGVEFDVTNKQIIEVLFSRSKLHE